MREVVRLKTLRERDRERERTTDRQTQTWPFVKHVPRYPLLLFENL